jgi:hypothetical protein
VPNELYKKFKIFCLDHGVDNSEGLELLLSEYFESKKQPTSGTSGKGRDKKGVKDDK